MSLMKSLTSNKRALVFILFLVTIYCGFNYYTATKKLKNQNSGYDKLNKDYQALLEENNDLQGDYNKIQKDYADLQKEFKNVSLDRDNLLTQAKGLLADRGRVKDLEAELEKVKKDKGVLQEEKDSVIAEKEKILEQNLSLKEAIKNLEASRQKAIKAKEQIEETMLKEKDKSGLKKLEEENARLKKEEAALLESLKRRQGEMSKADSVRGKEAEGLKKTEEQLRVANAKIEQLTKNYNEAVKKNHEFEQKVTEEPKKFAEIARQNKALIKETANMHYNLGVFYTKAKEYTRALSEFEKAVELSPDDASSHFNLGYIYAEHLVNRTKAIFHFQQYLRLAKKDDKDVDWVKKYILTWQSWQGRQPIE